MLRVFGCMCMALVPKHLRHNKLGAKAIWAVHLGMAQNSKGWLFWDPFTKKFLVSRDCKFMENLMYKDWKAENEAKIGMRFGEVKSSGLEHVELPLELSSGSTTTRQSSLVNGGEEAKDAEEEEAEVQQVSERAPTLHSRTTSAPWIRVTPQQRQGFHVPAAEEEGRGKRRIQAPNRLTYDALGKPAKSALAGAALIVGDDKESDYKEIFMVQPEGLGEGEQGSFMVVYVDDILIFSPSSDLVKEVMLKLQDKFKCKALGDVSFYLGLHIERDVEKRCMRCVKGPEEESVGEEERRHFHSLVGSHTYAAVNTRPDVAFATGQLARVVQCPNEEQVAAGMRVAKYLGQTPTVGLQYSAAPQRRQKGADGVEPGRLFLTAFSDASFASKPEDMTSVGGFICCVGTLAYCDYNIAEDVGAASASAKRRSSKGKGSRGRGGGSGGGGGGSGGSGGGSSGGGGGSGTGGGSGGSGGGGGGSGGSGSSGGGGTGAGGTGARRVGSGGGQRPQQHYRSETQSPQQHREWFLQREASRGSGSCPYVIRTGNRAGQTCGRLHTQHRCFSRLDDAWRAEFGDDAELPCWADLLRSRIAIFDLDFDAILFAMYVLSVSAEGECYRCVPPDPGIAAAALGASESGTLPATAPAEALHTFTLDSGASACFFRDSTTLSPLHAPVPVRQADPSGGLVVARTSTVLPCLAVPSGSLSGLHLRSFSTNLVSTASLQDAMVTTTSPGGQRVSFYTCRRTGHHLVTYTGRPGSSLYTLATEPPRVAASAHVSASGQVAASCLCRLLSHQTLLWHHRLGHTSLPRLRGMHSRLLVSGLPRSLLPLPPSPAPPCLPCVEGRKRAAPHSSFPPTIAPLQTLHMDVWGPARISGQGRERYFLLVVDDYTRYTMVFPLRSKGEVSDVLIPWIRTVRLQLRERFGQDLPVLRLHSDIDGEFSSTLLRDFCRGEGILQSFTLPDSPQQNGIAERRIGLVMEVARTSMIHAVAPHFLWPFAVRYAAHQLNLWPRVSLPETSPTLRWTGKVGDASVFRDWGSRVFVRDTPISGGSDHRILEGIDTHQVRRERGEVKT
ncbi:unnamed protein product [Closterium sp. NIES-54]